MFNADTGFCDFSPNTKCRKFEYVTRKATIAIDLAPPSVGLKSDFFSNFFMDKFILNILEHFYCKPGCLKPHPDGNSLLLLFKKNFFKNPNSK